MEQEKKRILGQCIDSKTHADPRRYYINQRFHIHSHAFDLRGFISMISKVKMLQEKNTERLKFQDFNICPIILHADADADTDAMGIAIKIV